MRQTSNGMIDLKKIISSIPDQLMKGVVIENKEHLGERVSSVLVCGMGGSGVLGELLLPLLPKTRIQSHHAFGLPQSVESDTLVIIVSYSGNTEETISSYNEALKKGLPLAVIAGGGALIQMAEDNTVPYVKIHHYNDVPTRFMTGYIIRAAYEILESVGIVRSSSQSMNVLKRGAITEWSNLALSLAADIEDKTVLIYTSANLYGLGYIWKEALNETAKIPAFLNIVPEMSHNEIESIENLDDKLALFLIDPQDKERINERFRMLVKLFKEKGWPHREINLAHPERIVDMVNTLTLALSVSLAMALKEGIDPTTTPIIDQLKEKLD